MKNGLLLLIICIFVQPVLAQDHLSLSSKIVQKKDTLVLQINFEVAAGMHVYAPTIHNLSQGYITMKLEIDSLPDGLTLLPDHIWPEISYAQGNEVYTGGKHTIFCRFTGRVKQLPALIQGRLEYQACNEEVCFPPSEKMFIMKLARPVKKIKTKK